MTFKLTINQALQQSDIARHEGRLDEVERLYREILKIEPKRADINNNLGAILYSNGSLDEAEIYYKKAIKLKPDYSIAHNNLGNTQLELGKLYDAEECYKKAIEFKSDYEEAYCNLGLIQQSLNKFDEAERNYKKALVLKPSYVEVYKNLGDLKQILGKLELAEKYYLKGTELKPKSAEIYNNLGNTQLELGKIDEAEISYKKAIIINPNFIEAKYNFGTMLHALKKYKRASEILKLIDFKESKKYLLECLFELDNESIFFHELNNMLSQKKVNAVIGSIVSRSEIKYGIKKSNPFCNEPLNYVLKTDLAQIYDFKNIFVKGSEVININKVSYKSQSLLTNGYQTAGNFFLQKNQFIDNIKKIIHSEVKKYKFHFKKSEEGFIKKWPSNYTLHGWLVRMNSGGKLDVHMHEKGWISGSIYINVPPKLENDCGNLVVCLDKKKYSFHEGMNEKKIIDIATGSLCMFPSSLYHYTIPFESTEERVVLAFDVIPK